ncbi:hypothetical protein JCM10599A_64440 [Paraburkholderia kururiensis]
MADAIRLRDGYDDQRKDTEAEVAAHRADHGVWQWSDVVAEIDEQAQAEQGQGDCVRQQVMSTIDVGGDEQRQAQQPGSERGQ